MKQCKKCKEIKDHSEFYKFKQGKDGLMPICKICDNKRAVDRRHLKWKKEGGKKIPTKIAEELKIQGLRRCPSCKETKKIEHFYSEGAAHCIICMNEFSHNRPKEEKKRYYKTNKDKLKDRHLRNRFGITLREYKDLLLKQDNKCAICGMSATENGKALAVDHSHTTGEVRQLLCSRCNAGIGFLKDNPDIAIKAAKYLENYNPIQEK